MPAALMRTNFICRDLNLSGDFLCRRFGFHSTSTYGSHLNHRAWTGFRDCRSSSRRRF